MAVLSTLAPSLLALWAGLSPITRLTLLTALVLAIGQLYLAWANSEARRIARFVNKLPGPPGVPLLGNAITVRRRGPRRAR